MPNRLEILLRKAGRELMDHQVARLFKVPEEMTQTPCDFFGFTAHGRAILLEAKLVHSTSLPIGDGSNGLQVHQWNELCDANRAGCMTLIAWGQRDKVAVIDVDMAKQFSHGRKSIPWNAIPEPWKREWRPLDVLQKWLPVPL